MNNEEKDIDETSVPIPGDEITTPLEDESQLDVNDSFDDEITSLEDDIIRNDTIPETSRDTPGSIGVFPVGAFDTSKD